LPEGRQLDQGAEAGGRGRDKHGAMAAPDH
jgi:hypothetical protein